MLDRPVPSVEETARETAKSWIIAFDAALARADEQALAELFVPDSHWRNLFGLSWLFATFSGREHLARELGTRAREVHAEDFRLDRARLAPRMSVFAGRDVIEAIFVFETANGPGYGALRLLPSASEPAKAWTISTSLDFDSVGTARAQHAAPESRMRDFAAPDGGSSGRPRAITTTAIPTYSSSAAAMPALRRPSS